MRVKDAFLLTSAHNLGQLAEEQLSEVAAIGRSNVGKSSLLNILFSRRLARTSNTPGKTRLINNFVVRGYYGSDDQTFELSLVDLPGYGFAKISQTERAHWGKTIQGYLSKRNNLRMVLHLVDIRHGLLDSVAQVQEWLVESGIPTAIVLTKADKLGKNKAANAINAFRKVSGDAVPILAFSSEDHTLGPSLGGCPAGREALWSLILQACAEDSEI